MEVSIKSLTLALSLLPLSAWAKVTYDDHVLPIFEQACLNCHNPDKTKGGLDLSTFGGTLKGGSGGKVVETQDTSSSLLAVVKHAAEPKMPPEGERLSKEQIDLLSAWIEGGLLENSSSSARKPSKPKFDLALKSDPAAKPDGPPPMPEHVIQEPSIVASRASAVHDLACSPWAPLLAITGQKQVLLHHTQSLELIGVLPFPEGDPVSLAFTPNGRYLIVGGGVPGKSGTTVTFDVTNGERVLTAGREFDAVIAVDLHPSLGQVATGSPSRLIKLWKTDDGSSIASIKKHTDWITALDYTPDGILLGTGDRNGGVWVWEGETGNEFHTLRGHQAGITSLAFRADSNVLATASEDGSVRFWEMNQGKEIKKLDAHPGGVMAFSWARDGSFATAGRNRTIRLWKPDFNQKQVIKDLKDIPTAVALDTDGKRVFFSDYRGSVYVHGVEKGNPIGQFDANPATIATRIASLEKTIVEHPVKVSKAQQKQQQAKAKLTEREESIAKLQQNAKNSKEQVSAAERKLAEVKKTQPTDPKAEASAIATLDDARKKSSDIDRKVAKQSESLKPLRETLKKETAAVDGLKKQRASLDQKLIRLQAAGLNAQSMNVAKKAEALSLAGAEAIEAFHLLARG
ncbi:MAG: c-type cytochrome domain-containing protein, partial [Verrucomicrobiota bacterium]